MIVGEYLCQAGQEHLGVYLFTESICSLCGSPIEDYLARPLPPDVPQVGRYAFLWWIPPEVGSWEADAGEWSGVYKGWSGGR